jgi:hypothetical protein
VHTAGGKSIHKAAEAPTFRGPSPASSYRKSLGLHNPLPEMRHQHGRRISTPKISVGRENIPVATRSPSPSSILPQEGSTDFTDAITPEHQIARKSASISKSKTPRSQSVAKKTLWKGEATRVNSDSPGSASSQESDESDSDDNKSSSNASSGFDIPRTSSSMPSPRQILSHIGRSKPRVTTHMTYLPTNPSLSKLKDVGDVTGNVEMLVPSAQITTTPPQALIDAFETLTIRTITFQCARRLPFLVRNLRVSFRRKCRKLGISGGNNPLHDDTEALLTYRYTATSGTRYTYQVAYERRECPLCSIFGKFSSWQALTKHMKWAHDDVEFTFDEVKSSAGDLVPNLTVHLKDDKTLVKKVL